VREARFAGAFTFQYSPRPGTPAAGMPDQVPREVVQERYERLVALQESVSLAENRALVGSQVEVLVAEGAGRKDRATGRLSGRSRDGRLVHLTAAESVRPGDVVTATVSHGAPHHLVADGPALAHRRTRAGDAWEAGTRPSTRPGTRGGPGTPGVLLGMPTIGVPTRQTEVTAD
jgi:tRNA-2-methylthio-N6-dimethylallyladenosine synthase